MMKTAYEIAEELRASSVWDIDLCADLCDLAGLAQKWEASDGEDFESVVYEAADILGVEIL